MKKKLIIMLLVLIILATVYTGCTYKTTNDTDSQMSIGGEEIPPPLPGGDSEHSAELAYSENSDKNTLPESVVYRMKIAYHPNISHITSLASCIMYYQPELTYPQVLMYARPTRFYYDEKGRGYNMGPAPLVFSMLDMIKNSNFHPTIGYTGIPTEGTRVFENNMFGDGSLPKAYKDVQQLFETIKVNVIANIPVIAQVDLKRLGFTDKPCHDFVIITGYDEEHVYVYFTWKMDAEPTKVVLNDFMEAWSVVDDTAAFSTNFLLCPDCCGDLPNIDSMDGIFIEDAVQAPDNIEKFINYINATQHITPMVGESGQQMAHAASIYYEKGGRDDISQLYSSAMEIYSEMDDSMDIQQFLELCQQIKKIYGQIALLINKD
ncbi:MAG: hypothetical protein ACOYEJ_09320 [Mahellales bacterium]|jgi:hypothetical protein